MSDFPALETTNGYYCNQDQNIIGVNEAHTKGDWTKIRNARTTGDQSVLLLVPRFAGDTLHRHLYDVGIGASGSIVTLLPNCLHETETTGNRQLIAYTYVPFQLPNSVEIWGRTQGHTAGSGTVALITGFAQSGFRFAPSLSRAVSFGTNTTDTTGTVIDPGASANVKGAWTQIESATAMASRWLILWLTNNFNGVDVNQNVRLDIGIGPAGSEVPVVSDFLFNHAAVNDGVYPQVVSFPCTIPSSVRLAVRAQSTNNDATDRLFMIAITGLE